MALLPVEEAVRRVTRELAPLPAESVFLNQTSGRVLAEDVAAPRDQPPFDASAMDGYAVRAADIADVPVTLEVIGSAPAGHPFEGALGKGQAVRIFTGSEVPGGADAIVMQEHTEAGGTRVTVKKSAAAGRFIRRRGLDYAEGEVLLRRGTALSPRALALAASMNRAALSVRRRPLVAVLATGDELVPPGEEPGPGQIISSNSFGLVAFAERAGAVAKDLGIARDEAADLAEKAAQASNADILVTLGGASVGEHDLVQSVLAAQGLEVDFWRIAMRPGKPLMFGQMGPLKVLGLPGNPVSALVCARIFLKPMLDALLGRQEHGSDTLAAALASPLPGNDERQDYLRARLERGPDGALLARPFERQDSSMLRRLVEADCFIVRPPHAPAAAAGERVEVLPLDF